MVFNNGYPSGMSDTDANINSIYADTSYCNKLFTAIFEVRTNTCTYSTMPTVTVITLAQFYTMISGGTGVSFSLTYSFCKNCLSPNPDGSGPAPGQCCNVGGNGCYDSMVYIGGSYYWVSSL